MVAGPESCDSQDAVCPGHSDGGEGYRGASEGEGEGGKGVRFCHLLGCFLERSEPRLRRTGRAPGGLGGRNGNGEEWEWGERYVYGDSTNLDDIDYHVCFEVTNRVHSKIK